MARLRSLLGDLVSGGPGRALGRTLDLAGGRRTSRRSIGLAALTLAMALAGAGHRARAGEACIGQDLRPRIEADAGLAASLAAEAAAMPFGEGKFFRVSKPGLAPSWLFGTIHHADPRVTAIAPAVLAALDGAQAVALEVAEVERLAEPATLQPVQSHVLAAAVARPAEKASALLAADDYATLQRAVVAHGMPASAAASFRPSFLAVALAEPACAKAQMKGSRAVDVLIAARARERGHPAVGLESLAAQFDALAAIPTASQGPVLKSLLAGLPYEQDLFETTTRLYLEGRTGWLVAWTRRGTLLPGVAAPEPPGFWDIMVDRRNRAMRDAALPLLARGGAFIAVGAAHLPGRNGLAALLADAGYTVERAD